MPTFVKVKCELQGVHRNWFLKYNGNQKDLNLLSHRARPQILQGAWAKYGEILVRQSGSYMTLSSRETIINTKTSKTFPTS